MLGVLQASTWGWLRAAQLAHQPFGFSLTPFMVAAGIGVLLAFALWQHHREDDGREPLIHFRLFSIPPLRAGLAMFLFQNLILMGDLLRDPALPADRAGLRRLRDRRADAPVSVALFVTALAGSRLAGRFPLAGSSVPASGCCFIIVLRCLVRRLRIAPIGSVLVDPGAQVHDPRHPIGPLSAGFGAGPASVPAPAGGGVPRV